MTSLRIGIISDLHVALPPTAYGGIERVVYSVAESLHQRGHQVTLFGSEGSQTSCCFIPFGPVLGEQYKKSARHTMRLWKLLNRHQGEFDVVHNFFRSLYLLPLLPRHVLKIISYACPVSEKVIRAADLFAGSSIQYTVCGAHMLQHLSPGINKAKWHVVYNPIDLSPYSFHEQADAEAPYLVFLSRLTHLKGAHNAIAAARMAGMRLVIAGNIQSSDQSYFDERIKPHVDGDAVKYIGPINDEQKNQILGNARAMLFPIEWEEPFGLVVGEAMACGTPVLAFRRGAMPELIEDGVNGFLSDTVAGMAEQIGKLDSISRHACRRSVEERFAPGIIAQEYEKLYLRLLDNR